MKYDLSVIIPVYNCGATIRDCLDSIFRQRGAFSYDTIVVDDGSTDNTAAIVREYQRYYPNLRLMSQNNAGVSAARNNGIYAAKGEYITFVDGDDMVGVDIYATMKHISNRINLATVPGVDFFTGVFDRHATPPVFEDLYFRRMLAVAQKYDADVVLGGKLTVYDDRNMARVHAFRTNIHGTGIDTKYSFLSHADARENANFALYRKSMLNNRHLRFVEGMHLDEDILFCMQAVLRAKTLATAEGATYLYRRHGNSLSNIADNAESNKKYNISTIQRFSTLLTEMAKSPAYGKMFARWVKHFGELGRTPSLSSPDYAMAYPNTCAQCPNEECTTCWYREDIINRMKENMRQYAPWTASR